MKDDELRGLLEAHSDEIRRHFDVSTEAVRREFRVRTAEIRRHFDVSTEGLKHEIRLVAEAVATVDEKLDRTADRLDAKIDESTAETHSMIAHLGRRIRKLEERN
jgi:hypothetical protein